jgi:hypothetical protein
MIIMLIFNDPLYCTVAILYIYVCVHIYIYHLNVEWCCEEKKSSRTGKYNGNKKICEK